MESNITTNPITDNQKKFTFLYSAENKEFFEKLVYNEIVRGNTKYSLTKAFFEGLKLLQEKYKNIPERIDKNIRKNKFGQPATSIKAKKTSILSTELTNEWIENFICFKIGSNPHYSKALFMDDIVLLLSKKYNNLIDIPKIE